MNESKKKIILSIIILVFFTIINIFSIIYVNLSSDEAVFFERPEAEYGKVDILKNGDTEDLGYIDDDDISLFWFIHVTDIHLDPDYTKDYVNAYIDFLNWSYNNVHPFTTIVTGDLEHGQNPSNYLNIEGSLLEELQSYFNIVNNSHYANDSNPYRYLDPPGNHDRNADWGAQAYLNYTLMGNRLGTTQSFFSANFSSGKVLFSMLDSAPYNAFPIPFGSEGNLDTTDFDEYVGFLEQNSDADQKFTFQHHHPILTFGLYNGPIGGYNTEIGINNIYDIDTVFYGHTHMDFAETWDDQVYIMGDRFRDSVENASTGEINRFFYHIISVDGGGVNYENLALTNLPNIIITNPSNPLFLDDADKIVDTRGDGRIRALIFKNDSDSIESVEYQVDGGSWNTMLPYKGTSELLFESPRGTEMNPLYAIPDDNSDHLVRIRVKLDSGTEYYYEEAKSTNIPTRSPFIQSVLIWIFVSFAGIVVIINRDNYPLKRNDGKRRRLTHKEKVDKRKSNNKEQNKPWWLSIMGFSIFLTFFFIPWGIFPAYQGTPVAAYTLFVYFAGGLGFFIESLAYTAIKLLLVFPWLYWGIRTYRPDVVNIGALLLIGNCGLSMYAAFRGFGSMGLLMFGPYFDLVVGFIILFGNIQNIYGFKFLKKHLGSTKSERNTI